MPNRKRSNIGRVDRKNKYKQKSRTNLNPQEEEAERENIRLRMATIRTLESNEHKNERLAHVRIRSQRSRNRITDANRNVEQLSNRVRMQVTRALSLSSFNRIAFEYDPNIKYWEHSKISIGDMDKECTHCHALKFKNETAGMCCASGKVNPPPDPLKTLMHGITSDSKIFLKNIRKINSCFQMTSFAANIIQEGQGHKFNSTFKIQGQVYHKIGSLFPLLNETPKFLQIYFVGDEEEQYKIRCKYNHIEELQERAIVADLEKILAEQNILIRLFKQVSNKLRNDNYMIVIKADKVPIGDHARR